MFQSPVRKQKWQESPLGKAMVHGAVFTETLVEVSSSPTDPPEQTLREVPEEAPSPQGGERGRSSADPMGSMWASVDMK
eukprot:8369646-Pyramimonas_sp.AAC.1